MPHRVVLEFERPILELELKIEELREVLGEDPAAKGELDRLEKKAAKLRDRVFGRLTCWQRVQLARHPARPRPEGVVPAVIEEFTELRGDRVGGDDPAVIAGLGYCDRRAVAVLAHGRGRLLRGGRRCSGLPGPVGLRKAQRLVELAGRFSLPLILLADVAEDGEDAADAALGPPLAALLASLARLPGPSVAVMTGEAYGAAGVAFTTADRVLMLEHAVCAPVTPETCARRELRRPERVAEAAQALRLGSADVQATGFCHEVLGEPAGGAHRDPDDCLDILRSALRRVLSELEKLDTDQRQAARRERLETLAKLVAVPG